MKGEARDIAVRTANPLPPGAQIDLAANRARSVLDKRVGATEDQKGLWKDVNRNLTDEERLSIEVAAGAVARRLGYVGPRSTVLARIPPEWLHRDPLHPLPHQRRCVRHGANDPDPVSETPGKPS